MITLIQNSNIRRIDELGRIVIPKDIRKKLHISTSETLEIYIEGDEIRIKKYSALPDITQYVSYLLDIGSRITKNDYILTTRESILAATEPIFVNKKFGEDIKNLIENCKEKRNDTVRYLIDDAILMGQANYVPIIIDGDRTGILIEYNKEKDPGDLHIVKIFANLIEKQLNNY